MLIFILVWMLMVLCSVYAAVAGGTTGRIGAALNVGATLALKVDTWSQTNFPVFIVDVAMLIALVWLALKSQAYWPIWAAGFHLITVLGHAATMISPDFRWPLYYYFHGMWAIFVQMAMVWGITLDRMAMAKKI
jgi:hypothetical protein